jgi:hypothetical protein
MKRFTVPRGAQSWELPLDAPDVLAAAHAVRAFLEGYLLTGNENYLKRATWFGWASLPFVYSWYDAGRPTMLGATIPAFGATRYRSPWFGVAVQWNGLVLAKALRDLAAYDRSFPWAKMARLIVRSAQWQQRKAGKFRGLLPDGFDLTANAPKPTFDVNPEPLLANLLEDTRQSPFVKTTLVPAGNGKLHLSAVADIAQVHLDGSEVRFTVQGPEQTTSYVLVAGVRVVSVATNRSTLASATDLGAVSDGWIATPHGTVIKLAQDQANVDVTVRFEAEPQLEGG